MKKILIIGANSYVGRSLVSYLSGQQEAYELSCISVRDDSWKARTFAGFDVLYHCAAIVHEPDTKNDPTQKQRYYNVNTLLPFAIAQKAKNEGVGQFVFLSSAAVYGIRAAVGADVIITEDTPIAPVDLYGQSKWAAEKLLNTLNDASFRVAVIRPPMIYGRGCKGNYNMLSTLAKHMLVFPKVGNRHFMIYIDNLSEFVRLIIDREEAGVFCPQNAELLSTDEIVKLIAQCHGKHILLLPGFGWTLRLLGKLTNKAEKAFGSLYYAPQLCDYPISYCIISAQQSIFLTEKDT